MGWLDSITVGSVKMDYVSKLSRIVDLTIVEGGSVTVSPRTKIIVPISWTVSNDRIFVSVNVYLQAKIKFLKDRWYQSVLLDPGDTISGTASLTFRAPKENGKFEYTVWADSGISTDTAVLEITVKGADSDGEQTEVEYDQFKKSVPLFLAMSTDLKKYSFFTSFQSLLKEMNLV